jgi:DNA-binding response OmpR family regulator
MAQIVVVLEKDSSLVQFLIAGLRPHFSVLAAQSNKELRETVAGTHSDAVILNLEHGKFSDVENLRHDFPELTIICTHRVPDETMWMAALEAGASDVCPADDIAGVLSSLVRHLAVSRSAAA